MQCTNNQKQVTLSVHNYHDVHNRLPSFQNFTPKQADLASNKAVRRWQSSILSALLPFIEQPGLYNLVQEETHWPWDTVSGTAWCQKVPAFFCPSDAGSLLPDNTSAANNYHFSHGDWLERNFFNGNGNLTDDLANKQIPTDVATAFPIVNVRGAFPAHPLATRDFSQITDGLSNTVAVSEHLIGPAGDVYDARRGIYCNPSVIPGTDAVHTAPGSILAYVQGGKYLAALTVGDEGTLASKTGVLNNAGAIWGFASPRHNGFSTMLPPNSPSATGAANHARHLITPSSLHTGGVVASKLDGSVFFVSETIDCGEITKSVADVYPNGYNGESIYGVWGTFGSINGGETTNNL